MPNPPHEDAPGEAPAPVDPTPIAVPGALAGLAEHDPDAIVALRTMREDLESRSSLDERTIELVRIGAMVALGAPAESLAAHVRRLRTIGADDADAWSVLTAVAPLVGVPALVRAAPVVRSVLDEPATA